MVHSTAEISVTLASLVRQQKKLEQILKDGEKGQSQEAMLGSWHIVTLHLAMSSGEIISRSFPNISL